MNPTNIKDMERETTILIKEKIMRLQEQLQELCSLLDNAESNGLDLSESRLPGLLDGASSAIDEGMAAVEAEVAGQVNEEGLPEDEADEVAASAEDEVAASAEDEVAASAEDEEQADAGVDPAPLRRMFTLNDRYRFRRELFGNLDAQMNEALDMLAAMRTIDEGADYLENDLCWDMSLPEVEEFMNILYRYYNSMKR